MKVISIDVGYKGGIAVFEGEKLIAVYKMPVLKHRKNGRNVVDLDMFKIWKIFKEVKPDYVVIENVFSMPKEGVVSSFRFGNQKGFLSGIAYAFLKEKDNLIFISPVKWKKGLSLPKDKEATIKFVNDKFNLSLKKGDDGIADAIAIGYYFITKELEREN
jgi:crossover junction endodeoxyribonuclease RuvC